MEALPSLMTKVLLTPLVVLTRYALPYHATWGAFLIFYIPVLLILWNILNCNYNIYLDSLIYQGIQQDSASLLYYIPGYGPYSTGFVGVDGKQAYTSSEYIQQPCSYGPDSYPCYTYDSTYAGNGSSSSTSGPMKSGGSSGSGKSNGFNVAKTNGNLSSKTSALPFNSKNQQPNSSRSIYQNQSLNPLNKVSFLRIKIYRCLCLSELCS